MRLFECGIRYFVYLCSVKNENDFHGCKDTKFFGDGRRGMGIFFRDEVRGESLELREER